MLSKEEREIMQKGKEKFDLDSLIAIMDGDENAATSLQQLMKRHNYDLSKVFPELSEEVKKEILSYIRYCKESKGDLYKMIRLL